jgi:predicted porin
MNKNLISFAVAAVLAGGVSAVSASNVTVFGKVLMSIDNVDGNINFPGVITLNKDDTNMNSQPGYGSVGVRGSEDLGNGLTAMFLLDYGINPSKAEGLSGRDQWVGLKGDFGTVRFGSISHNYKQSGAAIDPMWRTSLDTRLLGHLSGLHSGRGDNGQGRATNTVRYDSPSFSGAKVVANYTLDGDGGDNNGFGIGLHYNQGGIFAAFDYLTNDVDNEDDAWKLSGKYTMDAIALYGHYERGGLLYDLTGGGESGANLWHLGASYTMGSTMFYGAYGQGDNDDGIEYDAWRLVVNHSMSKRTSVYGGYAKVDVDVTGGSVDGDIFTIGMVHNF